MNIKISMKLQFIFLEFKFGIIGYHCTFHHRSKKKIAHNHHNFGKKLKNSKNYEKNPIYRKSLV